MPGANTNNVLDFGTAEDRKYFGYATQPLKSDYDLSKTNLKGFLDAIATRSRKFGWANVLSIPDTLPAANAVERKDLLTHYGEIPLVHLQAVAAEYAVLPTRQAQNAMMLALCLKESMTDEASTRIALKTAQYTVTGEINGPCLLKVITLQARIDTQYTVSHLRELLNTLSAALERNGSDIAKFNEAVEDIINSLDARGQEPGDDLGLKLFKAYATASDSEFVSYIGRKKELYDEHQGPPALYTATEIMELAKNKYQQRLDDGVWNKPSQEQEKIIALEVELKQLKNTKANKASTNSKKPGNKAPGDKKKKDAKKRKPKANKPAWM